MDRGNSNTGLKFMIASTILLGFLVIFIFLSSNNVSAQILRVLPA